MSMSKLFEPLLKTSTDANQSCSIGDFINRGFHDTGLQVSVGIPFNVRNWSIDRNNTIQGHQPWFGFRVTDRFDSDHQNPKSCLLTPDLNDGSIDLDLSTSSNLPMCQSTAKALCFLGWRGDMKYLISVTTSSVTQGNLSVIKVKGRYANNYKFNELARCHDDETQNNVIMNMRSESFCLIDCPYDEIQEWVNEHQYLNHFTNDRSGYQTNWFRNYIFIRPNTNITTLTGQASQIIFKIYVAFGDNFEWIYPTAPLNPNNLMTNRRISRKHRVFIFPWIFRVVSNSILIAGTASTVNVEINAALQTLAATGTTTVAYPNPLTILGNSCYLFCYEPAAGWLRVTSTEFTWSGGDLHVVYKNATTTQTEVIISAADLLKPRIVLATVFAIRSDYAAQLPLVLGPLPPLS